MIYRGFFFASVPGSPSRVMIPLYEAYRKTSLVNCLQESYKNVTKRSNFIYTAPQFSDRKILTASLSALVTIQSLTGKGCLSELLYKESPKSM